MTSRRRGAVVAVAALAATASAGAEEIRTRADLIAARAERIGTEALRTLMNGARVVTYDGAGLDRAWTHDTDGTFVASVRRTGLASGAGHGRWRITDAGAYCVRIEWQWNVQRVGEKWCALVYRVGDRYYGLPHTEPVRADDQVPARVIEIRHRIEQPALRP